MREMRMMLHLPADAPECSREIAAQLKRIFDVCTSTLPQPEREDWIWLLDVPKGDAASATWNCCWEDGRKQRERWSDGWCWDMVCQKRWARLVVFREWRVPQYKMSLPHISGAATLIPRCIFSTNEHLLPEDTGERYVTLKFHPVLWKEVDHEAFIRAVQDACVALKATYACIDEYVPLGGLYGSWFKWLSPKKDDVEGKLPGIYWIQMFSQEMAASTGSLGEIASRAPCARAELFDGGRMLMLQLSNNYAQATPKKRMALRTFFEDSLCKLSINDENAQYVVSGHGFRDMSRNMQNEIRIMMKKIPLTEAEIEAVLEAIDRRDAAIRTRLEAIEKEKKAKKASKRPKR